MNELFAMAFQDNPAMTIVFSPRSGRVMAVNQSCADKYGMPAAEIIGKSFQDLDIWEAPHLVQNMMAILQRDRKISGHELACRSPKGDYWHARISAVLRTSDREEFATATIEDITEQKRMEEALHHSEELYQLIIDCAGDIIWVVDLKGRYIFISHAIEHRLGYQPDEVIGQTFESFFTPSSAAAVRKLLEKISAQVKAGLRVGCQRVELELVRKNGSTYWSEVNFCGTYNLAGDFIGLQGIGRDVSDRKRAEEAARDNLRMLTDLAENLPGAAFQLFVLPDGSKGFHYLSPRAQEMFHLPLEWRLGMDVFPEDQDQLMQSVEEAAKTCSPWSFEGRFLLKSGEVRWFQGLARPTQKDTEVIFNGVLLDITERKRAEEALREADRRKDEFMAMLAHELRNPLAPIRNAVEVIKLGHHDEAGQNRYLALIERQAGRMSRLIEDLLDVARITRGIFSLRKELIALNDVVEQAIEASMILEGPRKTDFSCQMPEQKIMVEGDFTRLLQAIGNLLSNAIKFSDRGHKISLKIFLEPASAPDRPPEAVILVQDQGMGIDPKVLPDIFDSFMQADKSLDRTRGGLGIGLTLARRIVELHGGGIQANSGGLGNGCTFSLRLPAIPGQGLAPRTNDQNQLTENLASINPAQAQRNRVLVVDDVVDEVKSLTELLVMWGYAVEAAYDGIQAMEKFASASPGIVLLDIGMPGLDGYAVARGIRKLVGDAPLLLIAISGYSGENAQTQSLRAGFDIQLVKPIDLDRLHEILDNYQDVH